MDDSDFGNVAGGLLNQLIGTAGAVGSLAIQDYGNQAAQNIATNSGQPLPAVATGTAQAGLTPLLIVGVIGLGIAVFAMAGK